MSSRRIIAEAFREGAKMGDEFSIEVDGWEMSMAVDSDRWQSGDACYAGRRRRLRRVNDRAF